MQTAAVIAPEHRPVPPAPPAQADPERRRAPRYQTQIGAHIGLGRGQADMLCYILNVSDSGALLRPDDVLRCPSQFALRPELGEQRKCEVVWTNGDLLAVRFVGENAPLITGREWATLGAEPGVDPIEALVS